MKGIEKIGGLQPALSQLNMNMDIVKMNHVLVPQFIYSQLLYRLAIRFVLNNMNNHAEKVPT